MNAPPDEKTILSSAGDATDETEPTETERTAYTVSQVSAIIKNIIEYNPALSDIYVTGEISNYKNNYKTGHLYFTLKDSGSVLRSVMFRSYASKLKFEPENGMGVVAHGSVTLYARDGQHMLYCDSIEPLGIGALYLAFEQLKKKLGAEGLFDERLKKPLPRIPSVIGIVTSPTGAAVRDMLNILKRRFPLARATIFPALVQGDGAARTIIDGINYFNRERCADVIIIGRGGGSVEDLWAFNDEALARCVRGSQIPVISAVGHETDFTISDFAADKRAPTPSAAAELAVPDSAELRKKLSSDISRMTALLEGKMRMCRQRLDRALASRAFTSETFLSDERRMQIDSLSGRLDGAMKLIMSEKSGLLGGCSGKLWALSPLAIISRGYGVVTGSEGTAVTSVDSVKAGEMLAIRVSDGKISAEVKSTVRDDKAKEKNDGD